MYITVYIVYYRQFHARIPQLCCGNLHHSIHWKVYKNIGLKKRKLRCVRTYMYRFGYNRGVGYRTVYISIDLWRAIKNKGHYCILILQRASIITTKNFGQQFCINLLAWGNVVTCIDKTCAHSRYNYIHTYCVWL